MAHTIVHTAKCDVWFVFTRLATLLVVILYAQKFDKKIRSQAIYKNAKGTLNAAAGGHNLYWYGHSGSSNRCGYFGADDKFGIASYILAICATGP